MQEFKFLWSVLTVSGKCDTEIWKRIGLTKEMFQKLSKVFRKYRYKADELLWGTPSLTGQWMLDNSVRMRRKSRNNKNVVRQKMPSIERWNSKAFLKKIKTERTILFKIRRRQFKIPWIYNAEGSLGKLISHGAYWDDSEREMHRTT